MRLRLTDLHLLSYSMSLRKSCSISVIMKLVHTIADATPIIF